MGKFTEYIGSQFGNPRGFIGKVCCVLMNIINKAMYKNTVSVMEISSDGNILDIGYGNCCVWGRFFCHKERPSGMLPENSEYVNA